MSIKRNTLWNLFGAGSPMLIGVASIPYLLSHIGMEKLGVLTLIWALIGYFSVFDFGLGRALTYKISVLRESGNISGLTEASMSGLVVLLITGVVGGAIVLLFLLINGVGWLNLSEAVTEDATFSIVIAAISIPITTATSGLKGILEGFQEFRTANIYRFILGMANFLAPVFSTYIFGPELSAVVVSIIISRSVIMLMHIVSVHKLLGKTTGLFIKPKIGGMKDLIRFGSWMTLSNLLSPLMVMADRFVISNMATASVVAYYTVPSEFLIRLLIIPAALTTTLFPVFAQEIRTNTKQAHLIYKRSLHTVTLVMLPLMTSIALGSYYGLSIWLGKEFAQKSYLVVIILSLGIYFNSLAQIPHALIQANGDAKTTSLIHLGEFVAYAPMLFLLVMQFGVIGAAIAWVVRTLLDLFLLNIFAIKIFKAHEYAKFP